MQIYGKIFYVSRPIKKLFLLVAAFTSEIGFPNAFHPAGNTKIEHHFRQNGHRKNYGHHTGRACFSSPPRQPCGLPRASRALAVSLRSSGSHLRRLPSRARSPNGLLAGLGTLRFPRRLRKPALPVANAGAALVFLRSSGSPAVCLRDSVSPCGSCFTAPQACGFQGQNQGPRLVLLRMTHSV